MAGPQGSKAPNWLCSSRRGELSGSCIKGGCMELNKQCKRSEYKQDAKRKQERLGTERGAAGHGELALPPASAAGLSVCVSEDTTGGWGRSSQQCCVYLLEPAVGIKRQGYVKPPHSSMGSVLRSSSTSQGNQAHGSPQEIKCKCLESFVAEPTVSSPGTAPYPPGSHSFGWGLRSDPSP